MASKKKTHTTQRKASRKSAPRKGARSAASAGSRKSSAKPKTVKVKSKKRKQFRSGKSAGPRRTVASKSKTTRRISGPNNARIIRSSIPTRGEGQSVETVNLNPKGLGPQSGGQSGDLQGLSGVEAADSESVGELLEEGNAFGAEVVKGVEDVADADEGAVHTHQRPQEVDLDEDFREN